MLVRETAFAAHMAGTVRVLLRRGTCSGFRGLGRALCHGRERQSRPMLTIASTVHATRAGRSPPTESASSGYYARVARTSYRRRYSAAPDGSISRAPPATVPTQRRDFARTRASPAIGEQGGVALSLRGGRADRESIQAGRAERSRTISSMTRVPKTVSLVGVYRFPVPLGVTQGSLGKTFAVEIAGISGKVTPGAQ
jgi:hypothetical protein